MYEIRKGAQKFGEETVPTFRRNVRIGGEELVVEAGTSSIRGSVRGKGGKSYLSILCLEGWFSFYPILDEDGDAAGIEITTSGSDSRAALIQALDFCRQAINDLSCNYDS